MRTHVKVAGGESSSTLNHIKTRYVILLQTVLDGERSSIYLRGRRVGCPETESVVGSRDGNRSCPSFSSPSKIG